MKQPRRSMMITGVRRQTVTDLRIEQVLERTITALSRVERHGADTVIAHLRETDFFSAPASTKYHSSFSGGLALHSYIVYRLLRAKNAQLRLGLSDDTVAITGLLHDICKCGTYREETKNVREGTTTNWKGQTIANWVEKSVWAFNDSQPLGHGEKSVFLLLRFIALTEEEIAMIRWHMGPFDNPQGFTQAATVWPSIVALYTADMEAAHIIEARNTKQNDKGVHA
jgi:hypothetical protein